MNQAVATFTKDKKRLQISGPCSQENIHTQWKVYDDRLKFELKLFGTYCTSVFCFKSHFYKYLMALTLVHDKKIERG